MEALSAKKTVLIVDDTPDNLFLMRDLLKDLYRVKVATRGKEALEVVTAGAPPDLILLDIMMPEMDGYEVCRQLKADSRTKEIPVVFLTALADSIDEARGLEIGAADYITKPISPPIVLLRVKNQLEVKAAADYLKDKNQYLENEVAKRTREVAALHDVTMLAMGSLAETRDNDTGNHIRRTQYYVKVLAEKLQHHPRFTLLLQTGVIDTMVKSAPLHDIGKVGIPDHILLKPGRLTPEEFEKMKSHAQLGRDAIQHAEDRLGHAVAFLDYAKEIACFHHEKWDGSGYPKGFIGDAIPIAARLMAVADVYDALISHRVYKPAMPHVKAV